MLTLPWIILFLPLLAALGITLATRQNQKLSANLSIGAIGIGFVLSLLLFIRYLFNDGAVPEQVITWLDVGSLKVSFGICLDSLSILMLLVVTGVGGLIHWYSQAYMAGDKSYSRYFASLSFFTFSMLGIVLATDFMQMFVFWELVGVSSYLLIGFWFEKPSAADASKKAFLTNRIGDFGFLVGIIMIWGVAGTLSFTELKRLIVEKPEALGTFATMAGLLVFCGAIGKSAQFPLHVWLPDAMEGPTPVSALIHAATMVAAGVYMLCRVFPIFTPDALMVIAWIGGITALLAALMALQQDDIKRILAYSTLSQLGYMVMAVGVHAPAAAMYHLTTHACFKALLFLGAGSVIYALHHKQDIWQMGGLRTKMPTTYWTFLVGTSALCGVFPLSGFFSKDAILASAADTIHGGNGILFGIGILVAMLTTWYMLRLFLVTFHGKARTNAAEKAVESPSVMRVPLVILAVASAIAGFIGIEGFTSRDLGIEFHSEHNHAVLAMAFNLLALMFGVSVAFTLYWKAETDPVERHHGMLSSVLRNRFYIDEIYEFFILITHETLSYIAAWVDRWVISGLMVRGAHGAADLTGRVLRMFQTGNLQTYAFLFVIGIALVIYVIIGRHVL
ncbi:MAG: NADH-quinone oxidoreductase subunit L [Verrucomicrobia subdivision 3 bacterium]|nr:NADH-quinone oxidoreductase subunit L [Limisphaerales bacterium]MCS1415063.1 NADH-quinone oxidoreductase subunit L [Limisphaerales bacterium]